MSRRSVKGALCSSLTSWSSNCALERSECPNEYVFSSTRQVVPRSSCLLPKYVPDKSLGQCADGTCSPNKASCGEMEFSSSVNSTKNCPIENTLFGRCGDWCSWSPDECVDESWRFPSPDCSCDQVQVGACKRDDQIFCAVSPDGCDDKATWLSPSEVVSTADFRCYLCREKSNGMYHNPYEFENEEPYIPAAEEPYIPAAEDNTESSTRISIFIGGITGGVIGTAMVLALFLYVRKRQIQTSKDDGEKTAPCASVSISKKDDVSVLSGDTTR